MRLIVTFLLAISVAACSKVTEMNATGGSKADGTVLMSYDSNEFMVVEIDRAITTQKASDRCQAWGYQRAEAFDEGTRQCVAPGGFGCALWRTTILFQCVN